MSGNIEKRVDDLKLCDKAGIRQSSPDNEENPDVSGQTDDFKLALATEALVFPADSSSDKSNNQCAPIEEGKGNQDNQQYKNAHGIADGSAITLTGPLVAEADSSSDHSSNQQRAPTEEGKGNQEEKQSLQPEPGSSANTEQNETAKMGSAELYSSKLHKSFRRLSYLLGASWRKLGIHIGFNNSELDVFSNARPKNHFAETMLSTWASSTDISEQKQILIDALKNVGRRDLSDEIKGLPVNKDEPISAMELSNLAEQLGRQSKPLATYLGISSAEIEGIVDDHPVNTIQESAFEMLVAWERKKEKTIEQDKENILRKILRDIKRIDLAEHKLWKM